jgi:cytochrome c peroxidase
MKFWGANRRTWRRYILIIFAFLVCLTPIFWQFFQDARSPRLIVISKKEIATVTEPIQPIPLATSLDPDKVSLGKKLFEDARLSQDDRVSCVSCHNLNLGGVDRLIRSIGNNGKLTDVNTPTVFNVFFNFRFNWNGKFENLTDHLNALMTNPKVMGVEWEALIEKLKGVSEYTEAFDRLYPDGLTRTNIKDAIVRCL